MADGYVLKSSVLNAIHNGDIDMGIVTTHEYYLLKKLSKKIDQRIQRVPAADVQPVRHGRWIVSRTDYGWNSAEFPTHCKCSLCGREIPYQDQDNYCPNCGAKMDKEAINNS